jgi:hypothetical protein
MSSPCQASVRDKPLQFFGNEIHSLTECGQPATKKVTVDDGDAFFHICPKCLAKYLTKTREGTNWIGWFDCDILPEARVKGSRWYWSVLLEQYNKANPGAPLSYPIPIMLNKWFASLTPPSAAPVPHVPPVPPVKTEKDILDEQITALQEWMKTTGKTANPFETMKKMKELKELRTRSLSS